MDRGDWAAPTTDMEVQHRAGGRARYNSWRRFKAEHRRQALAALLLAEVGARHGLQAELARRLGVSEATISRDLRLLHTRWLEAQAARQARGRRGQRQGGKSVKRSHVQ